MKRLKPCAWARSGRLPGFVDQLIESALLDRDVARGHCSSAGWVEHAVMLIDAPVDNTVMLIDAPVDNTVMLIDAPVDNTVMLIDAPVDNTVMLIDAPVDNTVMLIDAPGPLISYEISCYPF
jgi:hypothetical protein